MSPKFRAASLAFRAILKGFLGNSKEENYKELVRNMVSHFGNIGANMNVKLHFLHNHIDKFVDNLGDFSEQHGERFHQADGTAVYW